MIELMENFSCNKAKLRLQNKIAADMDLTWADISKAKILLEWELRVGFEKGINKLMNWHFTQI